MDQQARDRQRYAAALRALCESRRIPPTGYALAATLRAAGYSVHPNTLKEHLNGHRLPRGATVQRILNGLAASSDERAVVLAFERRPAPPHVVSLRDALALDVDKGRVSEEVLWSYRIGRTDEEDECVERRRTQVGTEPLRSVSFGPGQIGRLAFDFLDSSRLNMTLLAQRESGGHVFDIPAQAHIVEIEPAANRYRLIVRFGEPVQNGSLRWVVRYRWPGLWRSLRLKGVSTGHLKLDGDTRVVRASVELAADEREFLNLRFKPLSPHGGTVTRARGHDQPCIRWTVEDPVGALRFEVRADPLDPKR